MKRIDYEGQPIRTAKKGDLISIVLPALEPEDSKLLKSCFYVTKDIGEELISRGIRHPSDDDVLSAAKAVIEKDEASKKAINAMLFMRGLMELMQEETPMGDKAVEVWLEILNRGIIKD